MNYRDYLQQLIYHVIDPTIRLMMKLGITPNGITAAGFVGNLLAMAFFLEAAVTFQEAADRAFRLVGWGGFIILAAGLFDMMDGRLARMGQKASAFGALWDSTLDRYSELVTLFGICLVFIKADWFVWGVVTFLALVGSVMVSYVRARAEGLGIECKVGLMQRPERVVVTAVAAVVTGVTANLWWLAGGMLLIAVLANITAFWRIGHCWKELKKK